MKRNTYFLDKLNGSINILSFMMILMLLGVFNLGAVESKGAYVQEYENYLDRQGITIPGTEDLFIITTDESLKSHSGQAYKLEKLDSDLVPIWDTVLDIDRSFKYLGSAKKDGRAYLSFSKKSKGLLKIVSVGSTIEDMVSYDLQLDKFVSIKRLKVAGNNFLILGKKGSKINYYRMNLENGEIEFTESLGKDSKRKLSFKCYNESNQYAIFEDNEKDAFYEYQFYNFQNESCGTMHIEKNAGELELGYPNIQPISDYDRLLFGTFHKQGSSGVSGVYLQRETDGVRSDFKFVSYIDFPHFLDAIHGSSSNLKKQQEKANKSGKQILLSMNQVTAPIKILDDGYIYAAELYKRLYKQESYTYKDSNGNTRTGTRTVFDGYRYTHAIVAKISFEGEIIWDISFPYSSEKTLMTYLPLQIFGKGDNLSLRCNKKSGIEEILIEGGSIVNRKMRSYIPINTDIYDNYNKSFRFYRPWYDDYYLTYAKIRTKGADGKRKKIIIYAKAMLQSD